MNDRILVNGDRLDEIVATDVTFHFEAMSWHVWWGTIRNAAGKSLDFLMTDFDITENDGWPITPEDCGELMYACPTRWHDRRRVQHQCEAEKAHTRHRCECGASTTASSPAVSSVPGVSGA